jgi:Zn2+/Cd2+-exporting ATPase
MEKYHIKNLDCASCAARIEEGVRKMEGVQFVAVNFATSSITLDAVNLDRVKQRIREIEPEAELEEISRKKRLVTAAEISENRKTIIQAICGIILLLTGLLFRDELRNSPYHLFEYLVFGSAYIIVGWKVIVLAVKNIIHGRVFSEYFLMTIATLGAVAIGEMPEAVAVMLFYVIGEFFQDISVSRSRRSIRSLLELKPEFANLSVDGQVKKVSPEEVQPGELILIKAGEKVPLDGKIISGESFVDTSALTGESIPRKVREKDEVLAGMINKSGLLTVSVTKSFEDSSISRIMELVENATLRKAETEKFITTFARYYTPVVVIAALLLATLPPLLLSGQTFSDWIYRALVVLVVSCPCALVISIPLGYFGGVGLASRKGILVKGSNFLDALTHVKTVVFDKTGTLTKGEFKVSEVVPSGSFSKEEVLKYAAAAEAHSNHPIALSILEYSGNNLIDSGFYMAEEISGQGIKATVEGKEVLAGNDKLMQKENIDFQVCGETSGTVVYVALDGSFAGHILIADSLKPEAAEAIQKLHKKNIQTVILSGDNQYATRAMAAKLNIDRYYADLMPEDKVKYIEALMAESKNGKVAFAGDGINDAPVLARADVGIAMGALGSDAAVETADVVLMNDSPLKVAEAIDIAHKTRSIVWQNIIFALGVKLIFIVLGIAGIASMWEAVFGDMGVALIAVFNAMRILRSK